ncbi:protein SRC2-like [Cornus florida]|uniref:protein SRC2-like n=1 Tax=Cornus florida TaxID=4283 RepID=UPI002898D561|nr:protein SRC2-like [Cornus florida]XP_059666381.1 protein SRC2-like [Cornus florida]
MASSRPPSESEPFDLDITIVSAKHLKNVNWRYGDLKPYAIFWVDPARRNTTKSDDSGSTRPVWNERFLIPFTLPLHHSFLTVEIFHSYPTETPKPLVGTLRIALQNLFDSDDSNPLRTLQLLRPSGRPQGKIRVKLALREHPSPPPVPAYHITPLPNFYYPTAPPPLYRGYSTSPSTATLPPPSQVAFPSPSRPLHTHAYGAYSDPNSGHYYGYYSQPPPPTLIPSPPLPSFDWQSSCGGPSAPVDYTPYDQRPKGAKMGFGTGLAVGAVAGAMGGLALEEGLKDEEDRISERGENDLAARNYYSKYWVDYGCN